MVKGQTEHAQRDYQQHYRHEAQQRQQHADSHHMRIFAFGPAQRVVHHARSVFVALHLVQIGVECREELDILLCLFLERVLFRQVERRVFFVEHGQPFFERAVVRCLQRPLRATQFPRIRGFGQRLAALDVDDRRRVGVHVHSAQPGGTLHRQVFLDDVYIVVVEKNV